MAGNKPYKDRRTFEKVFHKLRSWQRMADHFTNQGFPVTEATIRRTAREFELNLTDLHREEAPKASNGTEKARAAEQRAKEAEKRAREAEKSATKAIAQAEREFERQFNARVKELEKEFNVRVDEAARNATPKELAEYEQRILRAEQKANKARQIASHLARETNIIEEVGSILSPVVEQYELPSVTPPKDLSGSTDDPFSLLLSLNDIHWGEIIKPERVNGINSYSPNIAARRLEHVIDMTKVWTRNYRAIGEVDELVILLNGDNFSGMHNIHPDEAVEYARIGKQAMDSALVLSQAIWELSHLYPKVRVIAPAGDNHTRGTRRNATSAVAVETSWSSLHHEMIASLLANIPHVEFNIAPSYQVFFEVKGYTWAACHGHGLKGGGGNLGLPAYALKRLHEASVQKSVTLAKEVDLNSIDSVEDALALLGGVVKHTILGHFHQQFYAQFNGGDVRITPSMKGADAFSLDNLAKYNPAGQTLLAIHPEHDVVADHTINVQHVREEAPTRYSWGALEGGATAGEIMREWLNA